MQIVILSNDPRTGYARKVTSDLHIIESRRVITLSTVCRYYDGETLKMERDKDFNATDSVMVDQDGTVVTEGGVMTEYEYYSQMASMAVSVNDQKAALIKLKASKGEYDI